MPPLGWQLSSSGHEDQRNPPSENAPNLLNEAFRNLTSAEAIT
jgi:hypothetical protein